LDRQSQQGHPPAIASVAPEAEEAWMPAHRVMADRLAYLLRTSEDRLFGRGARFVLVGVIVAVVYLSTTTVLGSVVGIPFQIALATGFLTALVVHFALQRYFVWAHRDGFALPFRHQMARYLLVAGLQYGLTALSTSLLPPLLGMPTEMVYLLTVAIMTSLNFLVFRRLIFHPKSIGDDS
jgi:putative flippase GtrA